MLSCELGNCESLPSGKLIILSRFLMWLRHAFPIVVHETQKTLRCRMSLFCCLLITLECLLVRLMKTTLTIVVSSSHFDLGPRFLFFGKISQISSCHGLCVGWRRVLPQVTTSDRIMKHNTGRVRFLFFRSVVMISFWDFDFSLDFSLNFSLIFLSNFV